MAIDVGSPAIDRSSSYYDTLVDKNNPSNATGKIDHIEVWMDEAGTIQVASFYVVSGNNLSTRGLSGDLVCALGLNTFEAPEDFTAFDINEGDYIGLYTGYPGMIDLDMSGGQGFWSASGDQVPCDNYSFDFYADGVISLYATGTEEEEPIPKNVSDSGSGVDAIAGLKAGIPISDAGSGVEAAGLKASLLIGDIGSGVELLGFPYKNFLISDFGSGIEAISGPPAMLWNKKQKGSVVWQKKDKPSTSYQKKDKPSTIWSKK